MVKIRFSGSTEYCGTGFEEDICYDEMPTTSFLDRVAQEMAEANAESYEYLVGGWDFNPDECDPDELADYEAELASYWENIECSWEVVPEDEDEED
jgi:hypothetical protein